MLPTSRAGPSLGADGRVVRSGRGGGAWRDDADAVVLDLAEDLAGTRALMPAAIARERGGAEVFVRVKQRRAYAQVKTALLGSERRGAHRSRDGR